MQRRFVGLIAGVTVAAVLVVGAVAAAEKPVTSVRGNIHTEFNVGFLPKTLAKKKLTPIRFFISGKMKTLDGEHVPALKELLLEVDKNASISVKGIPVCDPGIRSQRFTPGAVRKACRKSLVGSGNMKAEIQFPEQAPIPVESELLTFNGGFKGGVTTLYLHAYITVPTPAAIVSVIKIKRINKGRYGSQWVVTIPKIAGGAGSITFLKLQMKKGILSAKCPDDRLNARVTSMFGTTPPTKLNGRPRELVCKARFERSL